MKIGKIAALTSVVSLAALPALAQTAALTTAATDGLNNMKSVVTDLIVLATPIMISCMLAFFGMKLLSKVASHVMGKTH
jgi:type III secretory pathway component EscT